MRPHIPKVDTGDDYEFMCGTHAFGATVATRDVCMSCVKRALEIVELLADADDELAAIDRARRANHFANSPGDKRRAKLRKRIAKALGSRVRVNYAEETEEA